MSTYRALLTRELIEHRVAFVTTPLVIAGVILLATTALLISFNVGVIRVEDLEIRSFGDLLGHMADAVERGNHMLAPQVLAILSVPLFLVLPFEVFFTLLGSLYDDRRDRSFLFWKSMPVSDWQEVGSKLAAAVVAGPACFFAIMVAFQMAFLLIATVIGLAQGGPVGVLWNVGGLIGLWLTIGVYYLIYVLWALPLFGWIMLASAYAPKAPLLYAVVPPLALVLLDGSIGGGALGDWIGNRIIGLPLAEALGGRLEGVDDLSALLILPEAPAVLAQSLVQADFWLGLLMAGVFFAGAVWLRRHNV